jgi:hypothetical protein
MGIVAMNVVGWLREALRGKKPVYVCGKCGRVLQDEESIDRGFGPNCWRMVRDQHITKEDVEALAEDPLPAPGFKMDPESGELMQIQEQSSGSENLAQESEEKC